MDAADILIQLEDHLRPLVQGQKGQLEVLDMEADVLARLALAPQGWSVMLCADGAESVEPTDFGGWVDLGIAVWLQSPKGLDVTPGKGIHRVGTGGSLPFMTRLANVIKWTRGLGFEHPEIQGCERWLRFKKWEWVRVEDGPTLRAAKITFAVTHALNDPDGMLGFAVADGYLYVGTDGGEVRRARLATFAGAAPAMRDVDAAGLGLALEDSSLLVSASGAAQRVRLLNVPTGTSLPVLQPLAEAGLLWAAGDGYLYVQAGSEIRRARLLVL